MPAAAMTPLAALFSACTFKLSAADAGSALPPGMVVAKYSTDVLKPRTDESIVLVMLARLLVYAAISVLPSCRP